MSKTCRGVAIVEHNYYGCESGCCGHTLEVDCKTCNETHTFWSFSHPDTGESDADYAKGLLEEEGLGSLVQLDLGECEVRDD